jgi:predicted PurR-regulated permease PerM
MKRKKYKKRSRFSPIIGIVLVSCLALVGVSALIPSYVSYHKHQSLVKNYPAYKANDYTKFWDDYHHRLFERGDVDGNKIISVQEEQNFASQFFGGLDLTVDADTKVVIKLDGTPANPDALICHLNAFYLDSAWIRPVCVEL